MQNYRRSEVLTAQVLLTPFLLVYGVLFIYPTVRMVIMTFTKAPLIGAGEWIGFGNYTKLFKDRLFGVAVWNTLYFVLL